MSDNVFDDLEAEQERLTKILSGLDDAAWMTPSGAAGWSVCDVVLHLAQSDEMVVGSAKGDRVLPHWSKFAASVDEGAEILVQGERAPASEVFPRWLVARKASMAALREADPQRPLPWMTNPLKPRTLTTTRLAEYWAHGLDITGPLGIDFPDTDRLRHIAWLGYTTLPYAFRLKGQKPQEVYCELTAPDGTIWRFGSPDADSAIIGDAGAFCRVAVQRLAPQDSGLQTRGPHGEDALRVMRTYAST